MIEVFKPLKHKEVKEQIHNYFFHELDIVQRSRIMYHLDNCDTDCRRMYYRYFLKNQNTIPRVSEVCCLCGQTLIDFVQNRLTKQERSLVGRHIFIEGCSECGERLDSLESTDVQPQVSKTTLRRLFSWSPTIKPIWNLRPAVSWVLFVLVLTMVYPTWLVIRGERAKETVIEPRQEAYTSQTVILKERGDTRSAIYEMPQLNVPSEIELINIEFQIPVGNLGIYRYDLELTDNVGKIFTSFQDYRNFNQKGISTLSITKSALNSGVYSLDVIEINRADNTKKQLYNFPFALTIEK